MMPPSIKDNDIDRSKLHQVPEETFLKITKEIVIKFIEMGRLTPATFDQTFKNIHATVKDTANTK